MTAICLPALLSPLSPRRLARPLIVSWAPNTPGVTKEVHRQNRPSLPNLVEIPSQLPRRPSPRCENIFIYSQPLAQPAAGLT